MVSSQQSCEVELAEKQQVIQWRFQPPASADKLAALSSSVQHAHTRHYKLYWLILFAFIENKATGAFITTHNLHVFNLRHRNCMRLAAGLQQLHKLNARRAGGEPQKLFVRQVFLPQKVPVSPPTCLSGSAGTF